MKHRPAESSAGRFFVFRDLTKFGLRCTVASVMRQTKFFVTFAFLLCAAAASAQTNLWVMPAPTLQPIPDTMTVDNIWQAIMAVAHYAGFSAQEIGAVFLIAKFLINYPLKNSNSQFANIVSHLAIEGSIFNPPPVATPNASVTTGSIPFVSAVTILSPGGQAGAFTVPPGSPVNTSPAAAAVSPATTS